MTTVYVAVKLPKGPGFERMTWRAGEVCEICRLRVVRRPVGEFLARSYTVCSGNGSNVVHGRISGLAPTLRNFSLHAYQS